jgi:hypothetical protein
MQQLNVLIRDAGRTGVLPLEVLWRGVPLSEAAALRVIPPGPSVPRILSTTDGIDMLSGTKITSRSVKVTIEEADDLSNFEADIDGAPVEGIDVFCVDPLPPRYEINFGIPSSIDCGLHQLSLRLGGRSLGRVLLEVSS